MTTPTLAALMARTTAAGACRLWTGVFAQGSPQVYVDGHYRMVRRLVAELTGPALAPDQRAVARCRDPRCIAPKHIARMTVAEVAQLAGREGRMSTAERRAAIAAGKRASAAAKLDAAKVAEIKACRTAAEAAVRFGVNRSLTQRIRRGESWRETFDDLQPQCRVIVAPPMRDRWAVAAPEVGAITADWLARRAEAACAPA